MTGLSPRGFLSLTRLRREGCCRAPLNYISKAPVCIKLSQSGFRPWENHTTALRARKCIPLWRLTPPPCPVGSMSLDSRVAYSSPMNPVPLPPRKRGHYNPCLLQSRLRREASRCFILPPEQGAVRRSRIGGGERSEPISRMLIMPYDTER